MLKYEQQIHKTYKNTTQGKKLSFKNKTIIENDYIKKTKNKSRKFEQNDIMIFLFKRILRQADF